MSFPKGNWRTSISLIPDNPAIPHSIAIILRSRIKKGAVIDERNNGGGSAADYMVDIMARDLHGYFNSRANDHRPFTTPMSGIWGPKVMLINERAGSGGDSYPTCSTK